MDILDPHKKDSTEYRIVKQDEKHYKPVFNLRKKRGLKLYSYNFENDEINEVSVVKEVMIGMDKDPVKINKAQYEPKLLYCQALNKKNAIKKFVKIIAKRLNLKKKV